MVIGDRELNVAWSEFKAIKTSTSCVIYYSQTDSSPNKYDVYLATPLFYVLSQVKKSADVTEFESSFKSTGISSITSDGALGRAVSTLMDCDGNGVGTGPDDGCCPPSDPDDYVCNTANHTTTGSAQETIITYTVPVGKIFWLMNYSVRAIDHNNNGYIRVKIDTVTVDKDFAKSLEFNPSAPYAYASAGQVIVITIQLSSAGAGSGSGNGNSSATSAIDYFAKLCGYLVNA